MQPVARAALLAGTGRLAGIGRQAGIGVASVAALAAAALAPASAFASSGGAWASTAPTVDLVSCAKACADLDTARVGSLVRVRGTSLARVGTVSFLGAPGPADDVQVRPARVREHFVDVRVPGRAQAGPLRLYNADGTPSDPTARLEIDRGPTRLAAAGSVPAVQARLGGRHAFLGSRGGALLRYLVSDQQGAAVVIQVVRPADNAVMMQWVAGVVAPGTAQTISWDGRDATGAVAPVGRYEFRVYTSSASPGARTAQAPTAPAPAAAAPFLLLDHKFPVRGAHTYGAGAAAFGATRQGHIHQGQDVFAGCGTPLVAAHGGIVKMKATQSLAGNYLVIDEDDSDVDDAYMHLRRPALVEQGEHVYTGQRIGEVGRTGDASACHLHMELWSGPGWAAGGSPFDPLPSLRGWDALS
jgi:murein DD-endopeptidase MepM/ murein hydrolase activator NlpD